MNSVASITAEDHLIELWASAMMVSRTGSGTELDPFKYSALGSGKRPIGCISWFDAARFCNWLHNGATNGASTETGAYELNGATYGIIDKNNNAMWWIPSLDEWCKAAYYKAGGTNSGYWTYPTQSDDRPGNQVGGAANQANYFRDGIYSLTQNTTPPPSVEPSQDYFTDVGVFSNSPSAYGTFDQAGNVWEWTDAHFQGLVTAFIGGSWRNGESALSGASPNGTWGRHQQWSDWGFRVATVAEAQVTDSDNDGVNDYRENKDGTDPNDPNSFNPLSKGLVAYYPFDGNANDESGFSRHIETQGLDFAENRFCSEGSALALTKAFSASSTVYFDASAPRTFSQWVKVVDFPARTDPGWFKQDVPIAAFPQSVVLGNTFAADGEWWLDTGSGVAFYDFPLTTKWTQITVVYEGNVVEGKVYRNGVEVPLKSWVYPKTQFDSGDYNPLVGIAGFWNSTNTSANNLIDEVRIYDRALSSLEVKSLFYETAFTVEERSFLSASPSILGHYSLSEYNANRTNGRADVTTNPSAFNLFTQSQFDANRTAGQSDVINNPMSYGLYTSDSIMDMRMGGLMIQKIGTNAVVSFQPQTTTDLNLPFTNNGTPITNTIPMPGNKGFLRINAKPEQSVP